MNNKRLYLSDGRRHSSKAFASSLNSLVTTFSVAFRPKNKGTSSLGQTQRQRLELAQTLLPTDTHYSDFFIVIFKAQELERKEKTVLNSNCSNTQIDF